MVFSHLFFPINNQQKHYNNLLICKYNEGVLIFYQFHIRYIVDVVKPFDDIIKVVKNIKRIDIKMLESLPEWFNDTLHKYQHLTNFSDTRINKLCILLNRQINKLKKIIEESDD